MREDMRTCPKCKQAELTHDYWPTFRSYACGTVIRGVKGSRACTEGARCVLYQRNDLAAEVEQKNGYIEELILQKDTLAAENERLREIVDKYPKTADGVTITPGMELFEPWRTAHDGVRTFCVKCWYDPEEDMELPHGEVYSTREAAEAAKERLK